MLTVAQLAESLNGVWHGNANHAIYGLSSLSRASSKEIACFDNCLLKPVLTHTKAGAVLLKAEHLADCPTNAIVLTNPLAAMSDAAKLIAPLQTHVSEIDTTAKVHPSVQLGRQVSIGAYAVLNEGVVLDDGVIIGAHSVIESEVCIGKNTCIACNTVIHSHTWIGQEVIINSGCVLGASPFNYLKDHGKWRQGLAIGGVFISDGVHIGANTVIDRGSVGDTYLANGVCIDNLVQIAHDVYIGSNTAVAGCAAIGSYVSIGSDCIIGGASCIAASVHLTNDVVISGMSTVSKSITKPGIYSSGTLVHEHERWRRNAARFRRLDDYIIKLSALERKISGDVE